MLELITNPDGFFYKLKSKDVRIRMPLLAVVLPLAFIISGYQYYLVDKLSQAFPSEVRSFLLVGAYIGVIGSFIGMFAAWFIMAAIMHGISSFFGGKGSFRRTFEFTGYGFLPSLIGSLISVPMSLYYLSQVEIPKISIQQLRQNPNVVKTLFKSLLPRSLLYSNLIINVAVTVWSLTIWTFAVKHAREIELRKAFITALIPTVLFMLVELWRLRRVF